MAKMENIPVSEIKQYKRNAKNHPEQQINVLMKSIKEFGFLNPIILDENNEVIAGHGRLEAAKKLGMKEVPCIRAMELNPEQVIAYRLADNRIAELGNLDSSILMQDLEFLKLSGFDMPTIGFDIEIPDIDLGMADNRSKRDTTYHDGNERGDTTVGYTANAEAGEGKSTSKSKRCPKCGVLL